MTYKKINLKYNKFTLKNKKHKKNIKHNKNKKHKKTEKKNISRKKRGGDENLEEQANKIKTFMITNKDKIKALFLKTICSNSGFCTAFGLEGENIKKFFNYFITGEYVIPPILRVGQPSVNGFVNLITYEREGYKASTLLKSTMNITSDNLFYEYSVGQYINKCNKIYPCFLETYGLFKYNTEEDWNYVKNNNKIETNILQNSLTNLGSPTVIESCKNAKYLALLIQYINNAKTFYEMMKDNTNNNFKYDLLYILYQIYMPLSSIADNFTHYDLHINNVLIYEPIKDKYIQYYYHSDDAEMYPVIEFKSRYVAKIIDYGRAYFYDETTDSMKIYNEVCATQECGGSACGVDYGYKRLLPERYAGSMHYISSQKKNISSDLRLLHIIKKSNYPLLLELKEMLKDVNFENKETEYGTKEKADFDEEKINNVHDAYEGLSYLIRLEKLKKLNDEQYSNLEKIGDLHVYEDGRPMEFYKNI
jgi:hypothetical protein